MSRAPARMSLRFAAVRPAHGGIYSILPDSRGGHVYGGRRPRRAGRSLFALIPKHLECIVRNMKEMGVEVVDLDDSILVRRKGPLLPRKREDNAVSGFSDRYELPDRRFNVSGAGYQHYDGERFPGSFPLCG